MVDQVVSLFDFLLRPFMVNENAEDRIFSGAWFPAALLPTEADCQLVPDAAEIETWHPGDDAVSRRRRLSLFAAAACGEIKMFRAAQAYMLTVKGPTTAAFMYLMRSPSKKFHRRARAHVEKVLVLLAELEGGEPVADLRRRWERAYQSVAISGMVGVWGPELENRAAEAGYGGDEAWRGLEETQAAALHELARLAERYWRDVPTRAQAGRPPKRHGQKELVRQIVRDAQSPLSYKQIGLAAEKKGRPIRNVREAMRRARHAYSDDIFKSTDETGDVTFWHQRH